MFKNLLTLKPYYKRYAAQAIGGVLFLGFCDAAECCVPKVQSIAIDALNRLKDNHYFGVVQGWLDLSHFTLMHAAFLLAGALIMTQFLRGIGSFLQRIYIVNTSRAIENDLRIDFFAHLQKLSPSYYDKIKTGDLMALAINDLSAVRNAMGMGVMGSFDAIYIMIYSLLILLVWTHINPLLVLYVLAPTVLLPILVKTFSGPIHKRFEKIQEQFSTMSTACQENFSGIRVVKAFVQEENEREKFRAMNADYVHMNIALSKIRAIYQPMLGALAGISLGLAFWLGGREVVAHRMSIGDLWAFYSYMGMLIWPMMAIGWTMVIVQQADTSMGRINEVFKVQPTIVDPPHARPLDEICGNIEFRNLTFTYPGADRPALENINLKIPAGSTLALVGPAGAGKTTMVRLIAHLYEVGRDQLFVDRRDITTIPLEQLRGAIGFVPQDTFLFSESIRDNIAYGTPGVDDDAVLQAAQVAAIHGEVLPLKQGYAEMLGERGINLSGGQKQRMAIARAVIKDPPILVLDDALSSVDTNTEEQILGFMQDVMKKRTSIMISHRLSSVMHADNIVILQDGRITESGTHDELLKKDGFYAQTYRRQQLEEQLKEEQ